MAINGWYVNRIITDIQEGKVDEFVNKEGKWFNKISGKDDFSVGNMDTEEFSVQGLGALYTEAITVAPEFVEFNIDGDNEND